MPPIRCAHSSSAEGWSRPRGSWFEPDLDRGLQRCEDALLAPPAAAAEARAPDALGPRSAPGLSAYLERVSVPEGTVLLHQDEPPGDVYVLASGRLGVETDDARGHADPAALGAPGVVVGEIALYTGVPRTADVVAETPSVVLRFSRGSIERLEAEEPEVAAALHRWLATTLAERLTDTIGRWTPSSTRSVDEQRRRADDERHGAGERA